MMFESILSERLTADCVLKHFPEFLKKRSPALPAFLWITIFYEVFEDSRGIKTPECTKNMINSPAQEILVLIP